MANCSSCGAEITWVKTTKGKTMPIDAQGEKRVVLASDGTAEVKDTYVSHFATCPNAAQHRKQP